MQTPGVLDSLYVFFLTRSSGEFLVLSLLFLLPLVAFVIFLLKNHAKEQREKAHTLSVQDLLTQAKNTVESFTLQILINERRTHFLALLERIEDDRLFFLCERIPNAPIGQVIQCYFSITDHKKQQFYTFLSTILASEPHNQKTKLVLKYPKELTLGQKRAFFRISPPHDAIKTVALWLWPNDAPLAKEVKDIGEPYLSSTMRYAGQTPTMKLPEPLSVLDLSGAGIGLRLRAKTDSPMLTKDAHILCLVVFNDSLQEEEHLVNFLCHGKITNIRQDKNTVAIILGIEFLDWALLDRGVPTINWFNKNNQAGIGAILQWVTKLDIERRRHLLRD